MELLEINLRGGISYNSIVEMEELIAPLQKDLLSSTILACALKTKEIKLIHINLGMQKSQELSTVETLNKATCMIGLS